MNIAKNINMRKSLSGFLSDIKRDSRYRYFWSDPIQHLKYRYNWNARPVDQKSGNYPLAVDVEFTSACNFRCVMCQQSTGAPHVSDKSIMQWDLLKLIIKQCVSLGVHSMKVNWRGESTLDPECGEKVMWIKSQGIHELQMNTNASKLNPELNWKLIKGLDRIIFSCDGLSKDTYNKIRRGGDFNTFEYKVKEFRHQRNIHSDILPQFSKRKNLPAIRMNMAVMNENRHEVEDFKTHWKDIADEICFNSVYQPQGDKGLNRGQHRQTKRLGCPQIWQRLIIDVHGNVMPCCVDYQERLKLGNVTETTLREIWERRALGLRAAHTAHRARRLDGCAKCDNFALSEVVNGEVVYN